MLAVERRKQILEQVHKDKKVIVSELSRQFRVSEETIRRDLEKLAEDGHVIKSYGGAVINEIGSIDLPFNVRWKSNSIGKQKIADLISQEIQDGEHIFLDASTTAVFIAKNIKNKKKLTVITNSEYSDNSFCFCKTISFTIITDTALYSRKFFRSQKNPHAFGRMHTDFQF